MSSITAVDQTTALLAVAQNASDETSQQTISDEIMQQMLAQIQTASDISSQFYDQMANQQASTANPL